MLRIFTQQTALNAFAQHYRFSDSLRGLEDSGYFSQSFGIKRCESFGMTRDLSKLTTEARNVRCDFEIWYVPRSKIASNPSRSKSGVAKSGNKLCCRANGPTTQFIPPLSNALSQGVCWFDAWISAIVARCATIKPIHSQIKPCQGKSHRRSVVVLRDENTELCTHLILRLKRLERGKY